MEPFIANGIAWRVVGVEPGDPRLVDRTGNARLATADPVDKVINISTSVTPPMLDKVILHEVAHAMAMSYGLLDVLHAVVPESQWVFVEEWAAQLVEDHGVEATIAASESLGRPLCIRGSCIAVL